MAYIPKSQIKHIKVNKEFVYKGTNTPYVGNAIVHSSGKYMQVQIEIILVEN